MLNRLPPRDSRLEMAERWRLLWFVIAVWLVWHGGEFLWRLAHA